MKALSPMATFSYRVIPYILLLGVAGCHQYSSRPEQSPSFGNSSKLRGNQLPIAVQRTFGEFRVIRCSRYCGGLTSSEKAESFLGSKVIISSSQLLAFGKKLTTPQFDLVTYPELPEGEVPNYAYRALSNFWGFGIDRTQVTRIEIRSQNPADPTGSFIAFEVIDADTLWYCGDGWLLELQRT